MNSTNEKILVGACCRDPVLGNWAAEERSIPELWDAGDPGEAYCENRAVGDMPAEYRPRAMGDDPLYSETSGEVVASCSWENCCSSWATMKGEEMCSRSADGENCAVENPN